MKVIRITDAVYKKLSAVKNNKSFSDVIDELLEESRVMKLTRIKKYFGIISEDEAKSLNAASKKIRNKFAIRPQNF